MASVIPIVPVSSSGFKPKRPKFPYAERVVQTPKLVFHLQLGLNLN